jgi:Capsule polysaccharide biosynthesis protein.
MRLKESNIKIDLIVDWFENQTVDRGFNKGAHDYFPNTKLVGYLSTLESLTYDFHLQPIQVEYDNGVLPDLIYVNGRGFIKEIKKYFSDLPVALAPAFRFNKNLINEIKIKRLDNKQYKLLVLLPMSRSDALNILTLLIKYFEQQKLTSIQILIKSHPVTNINKIRLSLPSWPSAFKQINDDFSFLINHADIVISTSSSACLESLANGVPVIIIGNEKGVTQNPIPASVPKIIWEYCCNLKELDDAINRLCINSNKHINKKHLQIAKEIRSDFY